MQWIPRVVLLAVVFFAGHLVGYGQGISHEIERAKVPEPQLQRVWYAPEDAAPLIVEVVTHGGIAIYRPSASSVSTARVAMENWTGDVFVEGMRCHELECTFPSGINETPMERGYASYLGSSMTGSLIHGLDLTHMVAFPGGPVWTLRERNAQLQERVSFLTRELSDRDAAIDAALDSVNEQCLKIIERNRRKL